MQSYDATRLIVAVGRGRSAWRGMLRYSQQICFRKIVEAECSCSMVDYACRSSRLAAAESSLSRIAFNIDFLVHLPKSSLSPLFPNLNHSVELDGQ